MSAPCLSCGGVGGDCCVDSGLCPGCGVSFRTWRSPIPAEQCAQMGRLQWACNTCGRLVRAVEIAAFLARSRIVGQA